MYRITGFQFNPIPYKGWVIQPTLDGYYVYSRMDSSKGSDVKFDFLSEAMDYIDEKVWEGST